MAETLLNKNQAGEGLWTSDNLIAGTDISITQVPQPVIDENTLGVWHFENNSDNAVSGREWTLNTSFVPSFTNDTFKFGSYCCSYTASSTAQFGIFNNAISSIASGNYTIDMWVRSLPSGYGTSYYAQWFLSNTASGGGSNTAMLLIYSNKIQGMSSSASVAVEPNSWHHIAIEKYGTQYNTYVDGTLLESLIWSSTTTFFVSAWSTSTYIPYYFDELRLSNIARYQGNNFTPFERPYTAAGGPAQYQINNTKADPDLSSYLQNTATGTNSLTIDGTASTYNLSLNIGNSSSVTNNAAIALGAYSRAGNQSIAIGANSSTSSSADASGPAAIAIGQETKSQGNNTISIGYQSQAVGQSAVAIGAYAKQTGSGRFGVALGFNAQSQAESSIQLGSGTNSTASTFQVFNTTVVDANGKIPTASLEADLTTKADTDLSNLDSDGMSVIQSIVSSILSGGNYMKKINTTTCTAVNVSGSGSTTAPFDGWMILCAAYVSRSYNNQIYIKGASTGTVSMPVKSGTVLHNEEGSGSINVLFFPEVS